jgi:hypothetical protein
MSFLASWIPWAGWILLAGIVSVTVAAVLGFDPDDPPLLVSWADKRDQQRMLAVIERAEARVKARDELEQLWNLPTTQEPQA